MTYHLGSNMSSGEFLVDAVRGVHENITPVYLFGFNRVVGTSYETLFNNGGGIYAFPGSAVQMSVVSSSASDTMDVQITGLDANQDILVETVTLTGTSAVTTTGSFLRINGAQITSGNNVGNITISNGGTTYAYIQATYGVHQASIYSVPRKHFLLLNQVSFTSGTLNENKYMFARACLRGPNNLLTHFFETTFVTSQLSYDLRQPFRIDGGYDFTLEAKSSSQENELSAYISGLLVRYA
jgi:hypothetical protein